MGKYFLDRHPTGDYQFKKTTSSGYTLMSQILQYNIDLTEV